MYVASPCTPWLIQFTLRPTRPAYGFISRPVRAEYCWKHCVLYFRTAPRWMQAQATLPQAAPAHAISRPRAHKCVRAPCTPPLPPSLIVLCPHPEWPQACCRQRCVCAPPHQPPHAISHPLGDSDPQWPPAQTRQWAQCHQRLSQALLHARHSKPDGGHGPRECSRTLYPRHAGHLPPSRTRTPSQPAERPIQSQSQSQLQLQQGSPPVGYIDSPLHVAHGPYLLLTYLLT